MRGEERQQTKPFSYASPSNATPRKHPIRTIRHRVSRALQGLSPPVGTLRTRLGAGPIRRLAGSAKGEVHLGSWPGGVSKRVMDPWRSRTRR